MIVLHHRVLVYRLLPLPLSKLQKLYLLNYSGVTRSIVITLFWD
jgi:hypothetical protein